MKDIQFPNRVWEKLPDGTTVSREATPDDWVRRREVLEQMGYPGGMRPVRIEDEEIHSTELKEPCPVFRIHPEFTGHEDGSDDQETFIQADESSE